MTCRMLLLFILTFCVCAESFVVKVTQSSYQAKENHNITMEWSFPINTEFSLNSLNVFCQLLTELESRVLLHVNEGVEVQGSQDEHFAGRVQLDKDVLEEGRVRLQVSRLRTSDSGLYVCDVLTSYGTNSEECRLRVSAESFVVNVTQSVYQANENHNITMEWSFTINTEFSLDSLSVFCQLLTEVEARVLLHVNEGVEVPGSQDKHFAGRVQLDKDVLEEGRVRLQVSRVRTSDSGLYLCKVFTSYGTNSEECRLRVCAESFIVNVIQSSYQAKENHNITMEWSFTTNTEFSLDSLSVSCQLSTHGTVFILLDMHEGVEVQGSQDEHFAGRVQLDKDVLEEGRVRLQVSRLRISDSGLYTCDVLTSYGTNSEECRLLVSAESFVVNVTQSVYQAKENHNITMEWSFPTNTGFSPDSLSVFCHLLTNVTDFVLLDMHEGVEDLEFLDEHFAGRVQLDKGVLEEGRVRLQVSRLRTADSGLYLCKVLTSYGTNSEECRLRVSVRDRPKPETSPSPTGSPQPENRGWVIIFCVLTTGLLAFLLIMPCIICAKKRGNSTKK